MDYELMHKPSYTLARVKLGAREQIQAESGAMVSMSDSINMETKARGGIFGGLRRSIGGESFFVNTFTAQQPGEVTIAPPMPGDIEALELQGETLMVQSGSFLAATMNIQVDSQWGGAKSFFSREGLFLLRCSGRGLLFVSAYGAIHRIDLERGERYTVDTGHMVAFDDTVKYDVGRSGGWKSTLLGGEGLVCKLEGPGRFYMQTRSEDAFLGWLAPKVSNR